jgi:hypothetical protein
MEDRRRNRQGGMLSHNDAFRIGFMFGLSIGILTGCIISLM